MTWNGMVKRFRLIPTLAAALFVVGAVQAGETVTRETTEPKAAVDAVAALPAVPAAVEPAQPVEAIAVEEASECDDVTLPSEFSAVYGVAASALAEAATPAAGCKPCKGRTWCKCTYNGMARVSCDPCCYRNNFGVMTCLD